MAFYPAVVAAAAAGGAGPGLLATFVSTLLVYVVFHDGGRDPAYWTRMALFLAGGAGVSIIAGLRRLARQSEREAARATALSEERFRVVAENARAVFGIVQGTRFVYANHYLTEISGYSLDEILSMDFAQMVHPDYRAQVVEYARLRQMGEPVPNHYEFAMLTKSGETRWMDFSPGSTEYKGRPAIVGTAYDITDRKRTEEILRQSEARLRRLYDSGLLGVIYFHIDGKVTDANDRFLQMLGYSREDLQAGRIDWVQLTPPEYRERDAASLEELHQSGVNAVPYEKEYFRKDGSRVPILIAGALLDEAKTHGVAYVMDITARRLAEERLRLSEAKFAAAFARNPAAISLTRLEDGHLLDVNDTWLALTGYARDDVVSGVAHALEIWPSRDARDRFVRELKQHGALSGWEQEFRTKSGSTFVAQIAAQVLTVNGESTVLSTLVDVTARKRAEEELQAATLSAQRAKAAAEEASRAKDHFLAVLSHELRNPLTPVLASATMLHEDPSFDQEVREQLDIIRRNAELEARLIDDLLDVTRITRGKVELNLERVELCTVIHRAVEVCRPDLEARGIHFGIDWGARPYWVDADVGRLQQVFWNLLKNAVKFTPHGGCIGVRCRAMSAHVVAEVNDSGIGIEADVLPTIFDAFQQAERSITRQFGGLGLGLTISKALIDLHGGTIEAYSHGRNAGASFRIRLPLRAAAGPGGPAPELRPPFPQRRQPARALNILLVEDHGDTARIMQRLLSIDGHSVATAADISSALDALAIGSFDLLISDLGLPDGSGLDLLRQLRSGCDGSNQRIPAIALSGFGQEQDLERSRAAGFAAHLVKPASVEQLRDVIARVTAIG